MATPNLKEEYNRLQTVKFPMDIAYGPVKSRRFGNSLGVNLLGSQKICSFNCPYCELGETKIRMNQVKKDIKFQSSEEIDLAYREKLRELNKEKVSIDSVCLSGNGDPTLYPFLDEAIDAIFLANQELAVQAKFLILTNGAHLDNKKVVHALNKLDDRVVKIDAGNDFTLKKINSPLVRTNMSKLIAGSRKLKDVVVQSCFVQGAVDNTDNDEIEDWIEVIGMIKPKQVQIYGLDRVPFENNLIKVDEDTLYTIGSKLKRRTQIEFKVY
jgi:wyosine [tRNA(Phe)-imidazoG37] synthetase (radical SAM superfamily)